MIWNVTVHWINLEGDAFRTSLLCDACNEDEACIKAEQICVPNLADVASIFTEAYTEY